MAFARFMAGPAGRLIRAVAGIVLLVIGIVLITQQTLVLGIILTILGAVFITVGTVNVCLISPLIGAPFRGKDALNKQPSTGR